MKYNRGFSIVEVLIVGGLIMVIAMGMASVISNVNSQSAALNQKLESLEIKTRLERIFATQPGYCGSSGFFLDGLEFSVTTPDVDINTASDSEPLLPGPIYEGNSSTDFAKFLEVGKRIGSVEIQSMRIRNIKLQNAAVPTKYLAEFVAEIKQITGAGKIKPITYPIVVETYDGTSDPRKIKTCVGNAAGSGILDVAGGSWEAYSCNPQCPAARPFICGIEICNDALHSSSGLGFVSCMEGCGGGGNDYDKSPYRIKCCRLL